ncbi:hypothetical protein P9112_008847 [Eukaryota sp. TZLM1-RC]
MSTDSSTLLVIAHPDDEILFFGPLLLKHVGSLHILCLSTGSLGSSGHSSTIGEKRTAELSSSLASLGYSSSDFSIIDDYRIRDGNTWNTNIIKSYVQKALLKTGAKRLVTFDKKGVSGHHNHKSLFTACSELKREKPELNFEVLVSSFFPLRFLWYVGAILVFILSFFFQTGVYWNSISEVRQLFSAFRHYESQHRWYRSLYTFFSIHFIVNIFVNPL